MMREDQAQAEKLDALREQLRRLIEPNELDEWQQQLADRMFEAYVAGRPFVFSHGRTAGRRRLWESCREAIMAERELPARGVPVITTLPAVTPLEAVSAIVAEHGDYLLRLGVEP